MPFITDVTWKPTTYRLALRAWQLNAPSRETEISPRRAKKPAKAKHGELSRKLRSLLVWRSMTSGSDWTVVAANDNLAPGESPNLDCSHEVRPLPSEIMAAIEKVDVQEIRHAKLGGGGPLVIIPVGGDIDRGVVHEQEEKKPDCIVRMGRLHFSNGGNQEQALVMDPTGKAVRGVVRVPLGGLTKVGPRRPADYFRNPKGAANDNQQMTVGTSLTASPAMFDFVDPLADAQEAEHLRRAVGKENARILDHALIAATFAEIGERLGFVGKTAERRGKLAVITACEVLEKELAV